MKLTTHSLKSYKLELNGEDILGLVRKYQQDFPTNKETLVRLYMTDGRYFDICPDYPIVIITEIKGE